jgi:myosin protein heavy chain
VAAESEWSSKSLSLDHQLASTRDQLSKVKAENVYLSEEKLKYERLAEAKEITTKEVEDRLAQATSTNAAMTRQLQHIQAEMKNALRRAEVAEDFQHRLQAEGTNLLQTLDEMRPKIVELTGTKLDLSEKVETLESALRNRDLTISQLENELNESRDSLQQSEEYWKNKTAQQERQVVNAEKATADIQKEYVELQGELKVLLASLRNLESERLNSHQEASRHLQEMERLSHVNQLQEEQCDMLKHELEAIRKSYVCKFHYISCQHALIIFIFRMTSGIFWSELRMRSKFCAPS